MRIEDNICNIGKYLFCWDCVPGEDNEKLLKFLSREFSLAWVKSASIEKIDEDQTIRVFIDSNELLLKLNRAENELNLILDDGRISNLIAVEKTDNLMIFKEHVIKISSIKENRICQGDILNNVKYIEHFKEVDDFYDVSIINFPLVVIISQDCDLNEDYQFRYDIPIKHDDHDKIMFSLLVAPIYTADQVLDGSHLSLLNPPNAPLEYRNSLFMKMQKLTKGKGSTKPTSHYDDMKKNEIPRYHFLRFPNAVEIPDSFIDFKHYFSVNIHYLEELKKTNFLCRIDAPYREFVSQRFSNYLSRIGLP